MLLVKVRYLAPIVSEAVVQVRVAGGTPSVPDTWEPRDVSGTGIALRGHDGVALAEQIVAAVAKDSAASFVVRVSINDDETVTFTFKARGFAEAWAQCPHGTAPEPRP